MRGMASSPASSDLSDPPSAESDGEDRLSSAVPSSRPSVDITAQDNAEHYLPPPPKRRKTGGGSGVNIGGGSMMNFDPSFSALPATEDDDILSISSDGYSSAPGSPQQNEYTLRDEAQLYCLWKDCDFGEAKNNDELVKHVQALHCATNGPRKTKYTCEWGECQRKASNHPSGYALKAHMRSHTKEKPYYCALPECDKAFTRSDALAKHMRTVHEPEPIKAAEPAPSSKRSSIKLKLGKEDPNRPSPREEPEPLIPPCYEDEDGNYVRPSPQNDNITYVPAHHPITGQPGFMINYPPDIHFSAWESAITADQLLRLLRRQVHWAQKESDELQAECRELEKLRRQEWELKEILLEGVMESELASGEKDGLLVTVDERVRDAMEADIVPAKGLEWTGGKTPAFRSRLPPAHANQDVDMESVAIASTAAAERTPSPPPTGQSGGFDGDADPYDNYLTGMMAQYEERERLRSLHNTPVNVKKEATVPTAQGEKEAAAVGALVGMSAGAGGEQA